MPGKYKSDELRKLIVEAKQLIVEAKTRIEASEGLVPARASQHPGDEVAKPESGPQPDRAPVGSTEAPRSRKKIYQ